MSTFRARGGGNALHSTIELPINLTTGVPAIPGTKIMLDKVSMTNPFRAPMLVDEIDFSFYQWSQGNHLGWGHTQTRITLGRQQLTKDFVPVWLTGPSYSHRADDMGAATAPAGFAANNFHYESVWRFRKPLFVPARESLITELFFPLQESGGGIITGSFGTAAVSIKGRSLPESTPEPDTIDIPYCASFLGAINPITGNSSEQSYERDLSNGFGVPLKVDMLTGRIALFKNQGSFDVYDVGSDNNFVGGGSSNSSIATNTLVRATSSMGSICVRDKTPFSMLFFAPEHAWKVNTIMPPNGFFKFFFDENYTSLAPFNSPSARVGIGLVGSRKVQVRSVYAQG